MDEQQTPVGSNPTAGEQASPESATETKATEVESVEAAPDQRAEAQETAGKEIEETKKPTTRGGRRINQLIGKLKEATEGQVSQDDDVLGATQLPPYWQKQAEFEPGSEVSQEDLNRFVDERAATKAELQVKHELNKFKQEQALLGSIKNYADELEKLQEEAPELDSKSDSYDEVLDQQLSELVANLNTDPRTGQFLPRKTPKQIYEGLKKIREGAITRGQMQTSVKMAEGMSKSGVLPASGGESVSRDAAEKEALFNRAVQSRGDTAAWAAYLKKLNTSASK